jgi:hypothetical protein
MEESRLCVDTRSCVWSVHSFRDPVLGWGKQEGGACFARASLGTTLRTARNRGKEEPSWHRYLQVPLPLQERVAAAH